MSRWRGLGATASAVVMTGGMLLGHVPAPAMAASGSAILEPAIEVVTADLDADGAREVVRLFVRTDGPGRVVAAEAWAERSGAWQAIGPPLTLRRKPWQTEALAFDPRWTDASGTLPVRPIDGVRMLVARDSGRDVVLVAATVSVSDVCCLEVLALGLENDRLGARSLLRLAPPADVVLAADLDGDGRDEVVTRSAGSRVRMWGTSAPDDSLPRAVTVWRPGEDGELRQVAQRTFPARFGMPFVLGDTDGLPGVELVLVDDGGVGRLARVAWEGGDELRLDETALLTGTNPRLEFTGVAALPGVGAVLINSGRTVAGAWPAGEAPRWHLQAGTGGWFVGVLGEGRNARIVLQDRFTGQGRVLDGDLRVRFGALPERSMDDLAGTWLPRYGGPLPGGLPDGRAALMTNGLLLAEPRAGPRTAAGAMDVSHGTPLAATQPAGVVGRGGTWLASVLGLERSERRSEGGPLRAPAGRQPAWLGIAPFPRASPSPADREEPQFDWRDAALVGERRGIQELAVAAGGYALAVQERPGSVVLRPEQGVAPVTAVGRLEFESDVPVSHLEKVAVVHADGTADELVWRVSQVVEAPPRLEVATSSELFTGAVTLSGSADGAEQLTIDGRRVPLAEGGRFELEVPASLVPRGVEVAAVDALGRTTSRSITAVGFVDYVSRPWLLAVPLLIVVAVVMLRRPPTARASRSRGELSELDRAALADLERSTLPESDGATLAEIEGATLARPARRPAGRIPAHRRRA